MQPVNLSCLSRNWLHRVNVRFHQKRSFKGLKIRESDRLSSAKSGLYLFCLRGENRHLALAGNALIVCGMVFRIIQNPATMTTTELMTTDGPNDQPGTREATSATAAAINPI